LTFLVAELGPTWMGDYKLLYKMMQDCKDAGVDAVKLQAFLYEDLNSRHWRIAGTVTRMNVEIIDDIAKQVGIEWFCMPTYEGAVDFLNPYMKRWKIRYRDRNKIELMSAMLDTKKPIYISTNKPEYFGDDVHPLYCINKYPTPTNEVNIDEMRKYYGYSCHTVNEAHLEKVIKEVKPKYLELHITPDINDPMVVDNIVSYDLNVLKLLVSKIRKWEQE